MFPIVAHEYTLCPRCKNIIDKDGHSYCYPDGFVHPDCRTPEEIATAKAQAGSYGTGGAIMLTGGVGGSNHG